MYKGMNKFGNCNVVRFKSGQAACSVLYLDGVKNCTLACILEVHKFENSWKLTLFVLCMYIRFKQLLQKILTTYII